MTRLRRLSFVALVALALSGCASDPTTVERYGQALDLVRATTARISQGSTPPPPVPMPARAALDVTEQPFIHFVAETGGASALMGQVATSGAVRRYQSANGTAIALRDGVVVQTRGIPFDLMAADVPTLARLRTASGTHRRVHDYLDGENAIRRSGFSCTLSPAGAETLTIAELRYETRRITERCTGDDTTFENVFWIDSGGKVRQSRQWIGPIVGFVRLVDLER